MTQRPPSPAPEDSFLSPTGGEDRGEGAAPSQVPAGRKIEAERENLTCAQSPSGRAAPEDSFLSPTGGEDRGEGAAPSQVPAGREIEAESFRIIEAELAGHGFAPRPWRVVRRMVHATADLDFARNAVIAPGAVEAGAAALARGAAIACDVRMIAAGLNAERLARFGVKVHCLLSEPEAAPAARAAGITRAAAAMRLAHGRALLDGAVVAVGNAPTALFELIRLVAEEGARPALVVGVPVGFVGAAESKEAALGLSVPHLVVRGRKGGTPAAVAALHALLDLAAEVGP